MSIPDPPSDEFLFHALMASTADSIYFKDRECRLLRVSKKMAMDLGFADPEELIGKTDIDLFGQAFGQETRRDDLRIMEMDRPLVGMIESRQMDGGRLNWTLTTKWPLHDDSGKVVGLVGITREINEIRQVEMALQHLATHDALTDLPNRFLLIDRMNQLMARSRRSDTAFAILFMDIDRFKDVNDTRGHDFGDLLLRAVAERLEKSVRQSDTVARMGGDEFVVLLDSVRETREAEAVAQHIEHALARVYALDRQKARITVSIGISLYPENGDDAEALLKAADYAMYLSKRGGGNRHLVCPPGMNHSGTAAERP
jgi:diguanylate cyclase (GGDEF)-like protein/PAS domain S-box-containing protein